jgi:tRNA(Ile)-lysidine synthase
VLVAVSGGADSTALLLALAQLAREHALALLVAHLDHGLRGDAAGADAVFVNALGARLELPVAEGRVDGEAAMRERGLSGEAGLRVLRRDFLVAAARSFGADLIATAHTADDQLETVLLRLARGTGLRGLGGMRPRAGRWIKPLLEATRADIEADLVAAHEPWREDDSNASGAYARNRVRHTVVPALAAAAGDGDRAGLARRVGAAAAEARAARAALARRIAPLLRDVHEAVGASGVATLPLPRTSRLPAAARRLLLRAAWRAVAPPGVGLTAAHLMQIERLALGARGPVALPSGLAAWREAGAIRIGQAGIQDGVHPGAGPADAARRSARGTRLSRTRHPQSGPSGVPAAKPSGKDFRKRGI